jgi:inosine/xanthosine triphosphatase
MYLFVGSTNPVKVNAVTIAASESWPEATIEGFDVPSGIAEQPMTDEETRQGAINRAERALQRGVAQFPTHQELVLGVGLEGGVFIRNHQLWSTVWVAVTDLHNHHFEANGARFKVPEPIAQAILNGEEMGTVVGQIMSDKYAKQKQGMIGLITNGFVDRTEEYSGIAKLALGLWFGRNWYDELHSKNTQDANS